MRIVNLIASILIVVGALNWGLWGFFQFDLVAFLFGGMSAPISRVIYALVGLAGLWKVKCMISKASSCSSGKKGGGCC
jgi:uncharacterized membrane protein YuzA (DUF378 family)